MSSNSSTSHLHKPVKQLNGLSLYFSGDIGIIVMDRGENRLNSEFISTMNLMLDAVENNTSCKGLITTGTGKFYSNGLDLEFLATLDLDSLKQFNLDLMQLMKRIVFYPIPTLAALNGHCYAGGALIAFCHDLRSMRNDKGWICFNEVFINRVFLKSHYSLLRIKLGMGRNYTDSLVLGKKYTAQEAFDRGLVHAMPSAGILITESVRQLKAHYGKSGYLRESLAAMKEDVYRDYQEVVDKEIEAASNYQKSKL